MGALSALAFTSPWLLLGLIALPILWILLRAVPPAPVRRRFPGVALLLGLSDDENQSDKTPWWLLLLRTLAVAAIIIGFAGPVLNPQDNRTAGTGAVLILLDGTWADAPDWSRKLDRVEALLERAARDNRPVALATLTAPPTGGAQFLAPSAQTTRLANLQPRPWDPLAPDWIGASDGAFDTWWLSDGLERLAREDVLSQLEAKGDVTVFEAGRNTVVLAPVEFDEGNIRLIARRLVASDTDSVGVAGYGLDPGGVERALVSAEIAFEAGATSGEATLSLPPELRNRITRFQLIGVRSAAAVTLTDDALRRREVGMVAGRSDREGLELLSPLHFLRKALAPSADLIEGAITDILPANPDVLVLADVARISEADMASLQAWLEKGGLLLRFAGPRLAASDVARGSEDPFLPVRLRAGGRAVGGAMSWGEPKALRNFAPGSPFFGLAVPPDVRVSAQVMAQPDPQLAERVIAALADGTPLVTRERVGQGQVVLFHVTANAEWSTLPLSGLFVQMLERLAVSTRPSAITAQDLAGTIWTAQHVLDGFGELRDAGTLPGVMGEDLADAALSQSLPPGLYGGDDRLIARNVIGVDDRLRARQWPARIPVEGLVAPRERQLQGVLLTGALGLLMLDLLASLWLAGRLSGPRAGGAVLALALVLVPLSEARAQSSDADAIYATSDVVLAHVVTGNSQIDRTALAGLLGLSETLFFRTSIEPADPVGVNLETDELAFFPLLYWPVTPQQPVPSLAAYDKLNRYLRSGGMILFDTRDAEFGGFGSGTPEGRKLQQLAAPLSIPALEPVPHDHVLTRSFYLLQDFPGRFANGQVWVEAAPPDAEQVEGMPFRNLNDGVTPVVIGANDWASAWAMDGQGNFLFPVGRGFGGDRQRELALRFGVNLVMHVLTGNYKSDQVHVPALLDRLGN